MYKCEECKGKFNMPDERNIDAGGIRDSGIVGKYKTSFIKTCPSCFSTNIIIERKTR